MEGASVLSPSSWEKRRAWVRQSRCWRTTVVEEEAAAAMQDVPELQPPHLDDVFLEGSSSSKIETWLQHCGSSVEVLPEELGLLGPYGCGSSGASFEDDLTLGAEAPLCFPFPALLLPGNDKATGRALRGKQLNLGHSMASSALSSVTNKTSSSISEVLEWWQADAEEILYNLGFVQSEPGAVARIPARFFSAPSQAKGIDFQLFLKAQVRRMEMEDPCLMLASRFQQVQALAATADAFFCLYSYVSKTPVQRISPLRLAWADPDVPDIRVSPAQPAVLSPGDRLKKAVAKMCLYTAPRAGDSPRGAGALGRVVQEVLERAREERFRFDPPDGEGGERDIGGVPLGTSPHGAPGSPPAPPWPERGVPKCHRQPGLPPRLSPEGMDTAEERPRCLSPSAGGLPWAGGAPCPLGTGQGGTEDRQLWADVASSPAPCAAATHGRWVCATPEQPGAEGDSGFGSSPWGTSPGRKEGAQPPGEPLDSCGASSPHQPRDGGQRARRSRGRHREGDPRDTRWWQGDAPGLQPPGKAPAVGGLSPHHPSWAETRCGEAPDSFEMEEVPSAGEDDGDAHEEAGCFFPPSLRVRRSLMLQGGSGHSDSSGFVEEPLPEQMP
ncbi:protein TESPA1 isoform X1 [Cygnus olor]|uniref:protein TESPA1 isoform X1 n=1 Tax=Cygnus olor TaxID=8869 RepID=UPI001ADE7211|nr:protein TESPA1 isoform X1 [Cygnus olor]